MSRRETTTELISEVANKIGDPVVAEHVRHHAVVRARVMWLPAVYSEHDDGLRARIEEELGPPEASGYMSEEYGWYV